MHCTILRTRVTIRVPSLGHCNRLQYKQIDTNSKNTKLLHPHMNMFLIHICRICLELTTITHEIVEKNTLT